MGYKIFGLVHMQLGLPHNIEALDSFPSHHFIFWEWLVDYSTTNMIFPLDHYNQMQEELWIMGCSFRCLLKRPPCLLSYWRSESFISFAVVWDTTTLVPFVPRDLPHCSVCWGFGRCVVNISTCQNDAVLLLFELKCGTKFLIKKK